MRSPSWRLPSWAASFPKSVQRAGIELDELSRLVVRYIDEVLGQQLAGVRPVGVRMRVVALEHDVVDADAVPLLDARLVGDETAVDVLPEELRGELVGVDVAPVLVPAPGVVDALPQIRHPADAAFGERDFEAGELIEHVGHQQVDGRHHRVQPEKLYT